MYHSYPDPDLFKLHEVKKISFCDALLLLRNALPVGCLHTTILQQRDVKISSLL